MSHDFKVQAADYLATVLHPTTRAKIMRRLVRKGRELDREVPFEAIAFTGNSGLLVGPELASRLDKALILVHKNRDTTRHCSNWMVEGPRGKALRYVFVDDLIATGKTLFRTKQTIDEGPQGHELVGLLLYGSTYTDPAPLLIRYENRGGYPAYSLTLPWRSAYRTGERDLIW